ncbi:HlyC/CorC family transporter [Emcibacter sp. SYSU 3D8]|uniref:HlyC/CorC family transporter n=1 Tax=Emcibacter sp. SYSU 3D8 TaxID=3133969 RepID=UPI0031FEF2F0
MSAAAFITVLAIIVLLAISAYFSAAETALYAASRRRMQKLARDGDARAQCVERLQRNNEGLAGAILLGDTLVIIMATALATGLFASFWGPYALLVAAPLVAVLVILLAEVAPKTLVVRDADRAALKLAPSMEMVVGLLSPVTAFCQKLMRGALRLFGLRIAASQPVFSVHDVVRGAIDQQDRSQIIKTHRDMLGSILDLDELAVSEVMVHRRNMKMIDAAIGAEAIVEDVVASPYTRIPVWQDNPENIIGVLHAKALLRALISQHGKLTMEQIQATMLSPWYVPETTSLREQLNAFRDRRSHFALVIDEYSVLQGLVTLEDILEEIVGDIADEHDVTRSGIRPQADGRLIVDGTTTIRDLNRAMDWDLSDEHATTIAGYVIHEAQTIPEAGQLFKFGGFKFEVLQKRRNQLTLLRITAPPSVPVDPL